MDANRTLTALKAGLLYFAGIFCLGFVMGTIRTLLVVPLFGQLTAVLMELPIMLAASWFYCGLLLKRNPIQENRYLIVFGGSSFLWLMSAELLLSILLFGQSLAEFAAHLQSTHGMVGLAGQIAFGLVPVFYSALGQKTPG